MKTRFLKNTATIVVVLVGLFFIMNDGKNEVIANEHKQFDVGPIKAAQVFKKIRFLPKEYTERVTDTILASGYHVTIQYKSLMNQSIIKKDLLTNGGEEIYYRKFASNITITKNGTLLFEIELPFENRYKKEILQYVWLDEMASSTENLVIMYAMYNPSNNQYSDYQIHIDKQGNARYIDLDNTV